MKIAMHVCRNAAVTGVLLGGLATASAWQTIYEHSFSGLASVSLNGVASDVRPGSEVWTLNNNTAFDSWKADGSVVAGGATAADGRSSIQLPFTPAAGNLYQLSVTLGPVSSSDNNQWIGTGFSTALNNADGGSGLWAFGAGINGNPWLIHRTPATGGQFTGFAGPATANPFGSSYAGSNPLGVRILLDTTAAEWTSSIFVTAANINGGAETQLGSTFVYTTNPTINAVGFTKGDLVSGSVDNFKLEVQAVPEPSVMALGLLGGLGLLMLRRRQ
jgi:hypothetical protein